MGSLGKVLPRAGGSSMALAGTYVVDQPVTLTGGSVLSLGGTWSNAGGINATGSTVNLGGSFTTAGLDQAKFQRSGGSVNLTGTLDNSNATLALNDASGPVVVSGGTIKGGTITGSGSGKLIFTQQGGTLDGVTADCDLDLTGDQVVVTVVDGLTLDGTATIGALAGAAG